MGAASLLPPLNSPLIARERSEAFLFHSHGLDLYLIGGEQFEPFADSVGILRELTYRQQLSGSGRSHDLDSRDRSYDHFLLVERASGELAGAARLQFVPRQEPGGARPPGGEASYLEHVYPGLKAVLAARGNHLEIGRVALAPRFQRLPQSLMCLFRGGLQVAVSAGYPSIYGLVSYNHFAYAEAVNQRFLAALMQPPFRDRDTGIPEPRYPVEGLAERERGGEPIASIQALEQEIRGSLEPGFRLPVLLRQYINLMEARVLNLSLARDFNQITEILMATELNRIPAGRLQHFLAGGHHPAYRRFGWFRG